MRSEESKTSTEKVNDKPKSYEANGDEAEFGTILENNCNLCIKEHDSQSQLLEHFMCQHDHQEKMMTV